MSKEPCVSARSRRSPWWLLLLIPLVLAAYTLVMSGMMLWHWQQKDNSPPEALPSLFKHDFGLALPQGARIVNAVRLPTGMDAAGIYELQIPSAAVAALFADLAASAGKAGWRVNRSDREGFSLPATSPPNWWMPMIITDGVWLELLHPQGAAVYHVWYSPSSGRCFIHWLTT